ncbi:MAG: hypothetical protein AB1758_08835 [Candidatus Eremiobacterota bacterium]
MKLENLGKILKVRPDLSMQALGMLAECVNASESIEGRRAKLEGFALVYSTRPDLSDDQLRAIDRLVRGSNCADGYRAKLEAVSGMLRVQPALSPEFIRELKELVDASEGVPNRRSRLGHVQLMLTRQPQLSPELLRSMAKFVNESTSDEGRELKLTSLNSMLRMNPALTQEQVDAVAKSVNAGYGVPDRRASLAAFEQALKNQRDMGPEALQELGDFVNRGKGPEAKAEYASLALQVLGRGELARLEEALDGAPDREDGLVRAHVTANDLVVCHGLGLKLEDLPALPPGPALCLTPTALLQEDSEAALIHDSMLRCHQRLDHYEARLCLPQDDLFRVEKKMFSSRWSACAPGYYAKLAGIGLGIGLACAGVSLLLPGSVQTVALAGSAVLGLGTALVCAPRLKRPVYAGIEAQMRSELDGRRAFWDAQLAARREQQPRLAALLAARPDARPGAGVREEDEMVLVGGVRVARRKAEE